MPTRTFLLPLLTLALACGGGRGDASWRFALEEIEGSVQHAYATRFEERIETLSGGRVDVLVYPYGALGTSTQITEQVRSGALQMAFASPGHLGSVIPEVQVFSLHFVLPEDETRAHEILNGSEALREPLAEAYREHGLELLGIVPEGWMVWTADKPLRSPADFRGFKMRTMASPLLVEAYRAYGANPTPLPYSEVYGALQLHMIDGQVNPVFAIEEMGFDEVQSVMTFPRHLQFVSTLVANPAFLAGLSPELRGLLDRVLAEVGDYAFEVQQRLNAERLEKILADGDTRVIRLDDHERAAFREASLGVRGTYLEMAGERGERILEALLAGASDPG